MERGSGPVASLAEAARMLDELSPAPRRALSSLDAQLSILEIEAAPAGS